MGYALVCFIMGLRTRNLEKEWRTHEQLLSNLYFDYMMYCSKFDLLERENNPSVQVLEYIDSEDNVARVEDAVSGAKNHRHYKVNTIFDCKFVNALQDGYMKKLADSASKKSDGYMRHEKALACFVVESSKYSSEQFVRFAKKLTVSAIQDSNLSIQLESLSSSELDTLEDRLHSEGVLTEEEDED